jgi:hypothetical protein
MTLRTEIIYAVGVLLAAGLLPDAWRLVRR